MNKCFLVLFILLIIRVNTQAQSCLPEGITFETQAQIDSFQVTYPNCTEIEGDVMINDFENDITNLNGLNVLTLINGDLKIGFVFSLNDLTGLENLVSVGGDLLIGYEENYILMETFLYSLSGLDNLTSVGGELSIFLNMNLADLSGLHNLASVGKDLYISGCYALTSLNGLEQLNSIGSDLRIIYNDTLQSLNGLENIDANSIANLDIFGNPCLVDCDIQSLCEYLASPNGIVNIHNNAVSCNSAIEASIACEIISPCLPYGNYYISSQSDIENFQTIYPNCSKLIGSMTIRGNDISNLYGINSVNSISSFLTIEYCDSLTNLMGLENLDSIGDYLSINNNDALNSLVGMGGMSFIPGSLNIADNNGLIDLTGLESINSLGGSLVIYHNDSMVNLTGLDSLDSGSISGLFIRYNHLLSACNVQSICDYLASPNGTITIEINSAGCNNQQEVEAACGVGLDESSVVGRQSSVSIYPNPSSTFITISLPFITPVNNATLSIYNVNTQQVLSRRITAQKTVLDISTLPRGVYFVKITDERTVEVGKFVKR